MTRKTMTFTSLLCFIGLLAGLTAAGEPPTGPDDIRAVLKGYRAAMQARDTGRLAAVVDPALMVVEGVHVNRGWADYRDNHIGPEMKEWTSYSVSGATMLELTVAGDLAYAVETATHSITQEGRTVVVDAAETFVLARGKDGWRIRHVHYSGKRRAPPAGKP